MKRLHDGLDDGSDAASRDLFSEINFFDANADAAARLVTSATASAEPQSDSAAPLTALGEGPVTGVQPEISVSEPLTDLAMLANSISAPGGPITSSTVGSGGATAAQVIQALSETGLSVNGSGIKVGVISDSFNDLGGAATDETDGALPSATNIQVLKDYPSGGTDEGRAMMQIVHEIAPGASLAFYTADVSEQDFANGILALAAAGCKVICDDVSYFDEPFFQNGVVARAIQTVEAEGVTYITSAGNEGSNGYQAAWTPVSGTFSLAGKSISLTDAQNFGGTALQKITVNSEGTGVSVPLLLEWDQAYSTVSSSTADLEILVYSSSGQLIETATNASSGEPTNPWVGISLSNTGSATVSYYIAIENLDPSTNPSLIKEITFGDGLPAAITGANTGTVVGHATTPGVITAGAVSVASTPAFGVNPALSEGFSSSGAGTEQLFDNSGNRLSSPDLLSPVVVSGLDDIATTVSGGLGDFYGTSAASASLAGVAALILAANPNLTPAEVEQIMEQTALPMANSAVSGAGLVQVSTAVSAAEALVDKPVVSDPSGTNISAHHGQVFQLSSLFSASDPDGTSLSYYLYDASTGANNGHFDLAGVPQTNGHWITVTQAQLSQTTFVAGQGASDTLIMIADNGSQQGHNSVTVTAIADQAPVVTDTNGTATSSHSGQIIQLSSLFSASDPNGDALSYYVYDASTGAFNGHFNVAGVAQPNGHWITVTQAQLSQTTFVAGQNGASDTLIMIADDGTLQGNNYLTVSASSPDHAPVVSDPTGNNISATSGQVIQLSTLFSANDPDNDPLSYYVYDASTGITNGHFSVAGVARPNGQWITLPAAQLGQTTFVTGQSGTSDTLIMIADDGSLQGHNSVQVSVGAAANAATAQLNVHALFAADTFGSFRDLPSDLNGLSSESVSLPEPSVHSAQADPGFNHSPPPVAMDPGSEWHMNIPTIHLGAHDFLIS
jgi:hypothetical protein